MEKADFIAACETIIAHDKRIDRIDKFLREDDAENGGGMFTYLPSTSDKIRRLTINLLTLAAGLPIGDSTVSYFFDECLRMKDGGVVAYSDGTEWRIRTPEDLWNAVSHEISLPTSTQ